MTGPHGGKRAGAGRKMHAKNKRTKEALAMAQATGETPAEILLRLSRDAAAEYMRLLDELPAKLASAELGAQDAEERAKLVRDARGDVSKARAEARACAEAAAPYFNPRLAQVEQRHSGSVTLTHDERLAQVREVLARRREERANGDRAVH